MTITCQIQKSGIHKPVVYQHPKQSVMIWFYCISLSFCILGTNTQENTWIHSVGIQAAAQLMSNLHDGNYTNIVLVDKWPHEDSDEIFAELAQIEFQNMITVKNLRIR